jgi:prophage maintenance system killer protein
VSLAARLAVGISKVQAFLDGNKRTAYAATDVFLRLNGRRYAGDPLEMAQRLEDVANYEGRREDAERDLAAWLRSLVHGLP